MVAAYKIPRGGNFPPLNGMVPQWWDSTLTAVPGSNPAVVGSGRDAYVRQYGDLSETDPERRLFDPRWMGAFKKSYGAEVDFRAVCFNHPGGPGTATAGKYLYLSWYIKTHIDMNTYAPSFVDIGFAPANPLADPLLNPVRFHITLEAGTNAGTSPDGSPDAGGFNVSFIKFAAGAWGAPEPAINVPNWAKAETRVWTNPPGTASWWAVHMRVPVKSATLPDGVPLTGTFGMAFWAEPDWSDGVINFKWPDVMALDLDPDFSDPAVFQKCFLAVDAPTAGDTQLTAGVSLAEDKIGTQDVSVTTPAGVRTSPQAINAHTGVLNKFFATPKNEDPMVPVNANDLKASFRLGNFGSTPLAGVGGAWRTLGSDNTHPAIAINGGEETIIFPWTPNAADEAFYNTAAHFHQCILVELSSSNAALTFLNASAARNMDFGFVSKFTREVEIGVQGLNDGYAPPLRDVYVYVERTNVPATVDAITRRKYQKVQDTLSAITSLEGNYAPEQRYVSIVQGDLRQLRVIDFGGFLNWLAGSLRNGDLVVTGTLFQLLQAVGVDAKDFGGLITRYGEQAGAAVRQLRYDDKGQPQFTTTQRQIIDLLLANVFYHGSVPPARKPLPPMEELRQFMPTVRYHVYHDTGRVRTRNGVNLPILSAQPSFGYYLWLDHDVQNWELRLQGAEKVAENFYLLRPPTEGSVRVTTSIHAVQQGEQTQIEPPEKTVPFPKYPRQGEVVPPKPEGCCRWLGPLCKLFGIGK